jgi:hypothetical protein
MAEALRNVGSTLDRLPVSRVALHVTADGLTVAPGRPWWAFWR